MKTILVVEDDPLIRAFELTVLRRAGYEALSASDGVEGAVLFSRQFQHIDLLVTDISLPGMRGTELAKFATLIRSDLKVLFASGSVHPGENGATNLIEGSTYIAKPFTSEEFMEAVRRVLASELESTVKADSLSLPTRV